MLPFGTTSLWVTSAFPGGDHAANYKDAIRPIDSAVITTQVVSSFVGSDAAFLTAVFGTSDADMDDDASLRTFWDDFVKLDTTNTWDHWNSTVVRGRLRQPLNWDSGHVATKASFDSAAARSSSRWR